MCVPVCEVYVCMVNTFVFYLIPSPIMLIGRGSLEIETKKKKKKLFE